MPNIYVSVSYEEYKVVEQAMREFRETVHTTVSGFYHKSIRVPLGRETWLEVHGPIVQHHQQSQESHTPLN